MWDEVERRLVGEDVGKGKEEGEIWCEIGNGCLLE